MSLFKVRTWWAAQCADIEENYDVASLLCTRFGLEEIEKDYIVVGSHKGLLSIFYPNSPEFNSDHNTEQFQATDLLLECQLKAHILAVLSGRFSGYQDLSHSAINNSEISPVWSFCLGEGVLDIVPVQVKEASTSIMILGERNLIAVNDHGVVEFILKLDFSPKCFCTFIVGYYWESDTRLLTAIISENSKLFIYQGPNLAWAAQLEDTPVALQRSNLNNLPGGIVTLGSNGLLKVSYLGSEQHVFQVPPLNVEDIHFERAHKELLQLEDEIKQAIDVGDIDVINQMAENDLSVEFQIDSELNECNFEVPEELTGIPMCSGYLKFKSTAPMEEIQIAVSTPEGVRCSLDTMTYNDVAANTDEKLLMQFYLAENLHIETSKIEVLVSFINKQGIPRVLTKTGYLPLAMLFMSSPPQKVASLKVTLNINSKSIAPKLSSFFPEFCSSDNDVQALGLTLLQKSSPSDDNAIVTIVTAKNSNRIRIQSDSLETLPLVLERIVNRINEVEAKRQDPITRKERKAKKTLRSGGGDDDDGVDTNKIVVASPSIPFAEILSRLDAHHSIQEDIRKQMALMDALWIQFKLFQRSLQSKSEGDPTDGLVMLIEKNYDDLIIEGDKLVELRGSEKGHRSRLSCALAVAKIIISCLAIGTKISNLVTSILTTPVENWTELSWELAAAPGIDMLHHYGPLSRSKSSGNKITNSDFSHEQFEYDRFRRHFSTLLDRVCRLASNSDKNKSKEKDKENPKEFELENKSINQEISSKNKLVKQQTLEALQDDEEEDDVDGSDLNKRPESDWLNKDGSESSNILANILLKNNA
ncbi:protein PTHB1 isoform X2 [Eupeodes corollae]|uniref:protein PTHB1 isoform X2 n=1 Tax=Eupeodes corollae TaxID=290404 RepID=UPI0024922665|nr:protein PTHB1 isoform X2 [Eupeodes corollae]